jgi:RimJ/RimL family protein N-acetyltransferase
MKYVGMKPLTEVEETRKQVEMIRQQYVDNGIGRFAVIEKESGLLIGWSGLKILRNPVNGFKDVYELGYRFLPEKWGKGYATESAKAWLNYGFNTLKTEIIYAYVDENNTASIKTLEKLGFENKGKFEDEGDICMWYELKKENFNNSDYPF